ncbi:hypothetical protein EDC04DRAFT_1355924 [Pisolithus marmoratus]|nr:hypothetical protein EDC04DRAFT_1355924 [Pisolithus marmoratus]
MLHISAVLPRIVTLLVMKLLSTYSPFTHVVAIHSSFARFILPGSGWYASTLCPSGTTSCKKGSTLREWLSH